ncbi:MAG: SusC/RagA family TonB-linked outer membrane protein [Bacteroidales bacterium]|nr:SusC/RagA family TonB-linked outer membrane protein [Bacteroidales bacterium]
MQKFKHLMKVTGILSILFILAGVPQAFAQTRAIRGTVVDTGGQPVIGAAVMEVGNVQNGAATDLDGKFTLSVPAGASISVESIGFKGQTFSIGDQSVFDIVLEEDSEMLEETVVVGYGTQRKASLTSAISNIRSEELTATKQADVLASLQGKVPGLLIRQRTGDAGDFNTDLKLRGYDEPLVIVDGLVRTAPRRGQENNTSYSNSSSAVLAQLNPEDIESISVLKDASAAIYGMGAENGVILVTTKQGSIGTPTVKYSNRFSFGVPTSLPEEVDILTWFEEANAMRANVGKEPMYSQDIIDHYLQGDAGWTDNRWYSQFYRKYSFQQNHQLSVNGGNNQTQYYLSGSFNSDNGILNGPQLGYKSFTFQGNLTTNITPDLKLVFQSSLSWNNKVGTPQNASQNFYTRGLYSERYIPWNVIDNPAHWTYNSGNESRNAIGALNGANGYDKTQQSSFTNNLNITYSAPFLKGLKIQGQASYDYQTRETRQLTLAFPLYDAWTDDLISYNKDKNAITERWSNRQTLYGRLQANYSKSFGQHTVGAMLAMEASLGWDKELRGDREYGEFYTHDILNQAIASTAENRGTRSSNAKAGYIGRINYEYAGKYMVEAMARYDGSYFYAPGFRWAFLPSYSLGWRVSEERFFKNLFPFISNLKLRWSDGISGGNQGAPYQYLLGYSQTGTNYMFADGSPVMGYSSTQVAETLLSWTRTYMRDFGFDWELKKGIIGGSIDWFWRNQTGKAAKVSATLPDMYGIDLPQLNLNTTQNVGIDFELSHRMHFQDFNYRITATATFTRERDTYQETERTAIYTSSQDYFENHTEGRWDNALDGLYYEWNGRGQFVDWNDIFNYPVLYSSSSSKKSNMSEMLPGMYKIDDRNGDGVITAADRYYSWKEGNPPLQFGLMIFLEWKNFDLSATFNGAAMSHKNMQLSGGMGYGWSKTLFVNHMDHYRLADGSTDPRDPNSVWEPGYWPALAPATGAEDAKSNATYRFTQPYSWVDNSFFRLKSLEIGYNVPKDVLRRIHLKSVRVHASATNLFTICNPIVRVWDPETYQSSRRGASGAPLLRTFVIGTSISF